MADGPNLKREPAAVVPLVAAHAHGDVVAERQRVAPPLAIGYELVGFMGERPMFGLPSADLAVMGGSEAALIIQAIVEAPVRRDLDVLRVAGAAKPSCDLRSPHRISVASHVRTWLAGLRLADRDATLSQRLSRWLATATRFADPLAPKLALCRVFRSWHGANSNAQIGGICHG